MGRVARGAVAIATVCSVLIGCQYQADLNALLGGMQQAVAICDEFDQAVGIAFTGAYSGHHAYVLDVLDEDNSAVLKSVDISDPTRPIVAATLALPSTESVDTSSGGYRASLVESNGHVYIAHKDFFVVDVSDPTDLVMAGVVYADPSFAFCGVAVDVNSGLAVVTPHFNVMDISNPSAPYERAYLNLGVYYRAPPVLSDSVAYTIDDGNLVIVDLSDPDNPVILADPAHSPANPYGSLGIAARDRILAFGGTLQGMDVLDVSDPVNVSVVSNTPLAYGWSNGANGLGYQAGNHSCVGEVSIYDAQNPYVSCFSVPQALLTPGSSPRGITRVGDDQMILVPYGDLGVVVFDLW